MFEELKQKYTDLSYREQLLVSGSIIVAIAVLWFLLLIEPAEKQSVALDKEIKKIENNLAQLTKQHQKLIERRATDPNKEVKDRIALTDKQLNDINQQLSRKFHGLIEPRIMANVLESILQKHGRLKLVSVKSMPAEPLITPQEKTVEEAETTDSVNEIPADEKVTVYKHGMQITFEGDYLSTHAYLKTLEELKWEFYWDEVQLDITQYPKASIVITVHTLSLKDSWIGV